MRPPSYLFQVAITWYIYKDKLVCLLEMITQPYIRRSTRRTFLFLHPLSALSKMASPRARSPADSIPASSPPSRRERYSHSSPIRSHSRSRERSHRHAQSSPTRGRGSSKDQRRHETERNCEREFADRIKQLECKNLSLQRAALTPAGGKKKRTHA